MSIWKKIEILLFTYPQIQFQLQYRSKCEMQYFQLLEEYFWKCLYEPGLGRISKQKTKQMENADKCAYLKIKQFFFTKEK